MSLIGILLNSQRKFYLSEWFKTGFKSCHYSFVKTIFANFNYVDKILKCVLIHQLEHFLA